MAINFPSTPSLDQVYTYEGRSWRWNGTYWQSTAVAVGYSGSQGDVGFVGSQGIQGDLGYTGSQGDLGYTGSQGDQGSIGYVGSQGDLGYTGSQGDLGYTGSQGIQGDLGYTGSEGESSFTWGNIAPADPVVGDRWYDTVTGCLTVYVDDGDSQQWVEVSASGFLGQTGYTGSAGTGGVTLSPLLVNQTHITSNISIEAGTNAISVGPITQAADTVISISAGQRWIIL